MRSTLVASRMETIETILEVAPSLKEIVEKARGIHRIRVD